MFNTILCAYLYILFSEISVHVFFPFSNWTVFVFELYELFVYFENETFVGCIICKYFLPVSRLSFCIVYGFL